MSTARSTAFRAQGDAAQVAAAIAADRAPSSTSLVFASTEYELNAVGAELLRRGADRVIGAATGRVISAAGFRPNGVTGFHLPPGRFRAVDTLFKEVESLPLPQLRGLSTGKRQRIAIVRAVLTDPLIVVLDEATSGLDIEATRLVHEALDTAFRGAHPPCGHPSVRRGAGRNCAGNSKTAAGAGGQRLNWRVGLSA